MERPIDPRIQLLTEMRFRRLLCLSYLFGLALAGCAEPNPLPEALTDEASAAKKLYIAKCAKCHKFYDPAKYSEEEWHKWMAKMSKKSKLTPEQSEMLSRYIDNTFRSSNKDGPQTKG
jgi:hypothetical protein